MGAFLFRNRGWLPVPVLIVAIALCGPLGPATAMGLALLPLGLLIRLWAMLHIGPDARKKEIFVQKLVYTGPYELSRNPLYIANIFAYTGVGLATLGLPGAIGAVVLAATYYSLIVRHEEVELERRLGEVYRSYRNRVPRWMGESAPVHAAAPKGEMEDRLNNAVRAERSTYGVAFMVVSAVILRAATAG